jgi:hypothetical protein
VSKAVKTTIYKMMMKPVVVCGSETWSVTEVDMKRLNKMGEENIKGDVRIIGRTRNMENQT